MKIARAATNLFAIRTIERTLETSKWNETKQFLSSNFLAHRRRAHVHEAQYCWAKHAFQSHLFHFDHVVAVIAAAGIANQTVSKKEENKNKRKSEERLISPSFIGKIKMWKKGRTNERWNEKIIIISVVEIGKTVEEAKTKREKKKNEIEIIYLENIFIMYFYFANLSSRSLFIAMRAPCISFVHVAESIRIQLPRRNRNSYTYMRERVQP